LVRPALFSAGWFAYMFVTKSRSLLTSEAHPDAAAARVEYSVVEYWSRNATGW
jgi:hypothetical protein